MYEKIIGHVLLIYSWIEGLFILTIQAFEGFHNDMKFVVTKCTQ